MQIECIIVDDDPQSRVSLERVAEKTGLLKVVSIFSNATDAMAFLKDNPIDLILLDVEMPDVTGLEMIQRLEYVPKVIFTSSKAEYAYEAFQLKATNYLKKPVTLPTLQNALQEIIYESESKENKTQYLFAKESKKLKRIRLEEVAYVENVADYVKIVTRKDTILVYKNMKDLLELLPNNFLRIHRSFIVNLDFIDHIEEMGVFVIDRYLSVSRNKKLELLQKLEIL